ncbi:MAG: nitrogen fixation protein NifZ [Gammaproteobacteria bacterium]|jgi:nitrogen fixation protein NifZ
MTLDQLQPGDIVYAASHIVNDGSIPALDGLATIATPGTRGVIINIGHLEEAPQRELFLVRFETTDLQLGPPTGCWPEELSAQPPDNLME